MRPVRFGLAAILAVFGLAGFGAQPAFAAPPTILIDGQKLQSDAPAIEVDGHVLVPLRAIAERLGASVTYDDKTQVVFAQLDGRSVKLTIGKTRAFVDGKPVTLDVSARTFAGRTEVPLRFVGTSLGAMVDYDPATDTVAVVTGNAPGNFVAAISGRRSASSYAYAPAAAPATISDERPAPESVVGSSYPEIYARLAGGSSAVDPASLRITLDGNDVTGDATISAAYVSYTPSHRLSNGLHTVDVSGRTDDGAPFDEQWTFSVDAGMSSDYVSSIIDQYPGAFGYPGYGFYPPGFSLFVPGPRYFVVGNIIEVVLFSPFYQVGSCFVNITGFPQSYPCVAWNGFPGYFNCWIPVPYGFAVTNATVAAHFYTIGGPRVVVHATAPITVNGKRSTLPEQMRFVNLATVVRHPLSPFHLVAVRHETPSVTTINHPVTTGPGYIHIISLPPNGSSNLPTVNSHVVPTSPTTVHINPPHPSHPLPPHGSQGTGGQGSGGQGSGGQSSGGSHGSSGGQGSGGQSGGGNPKPTPAP